MNAAIKMYTSNDYNWMFDNKTGQFIRWGKTIHDDPNYSPVGPEILDLEISTICSQGCKHCYKSNTSTGKIMTYDTFVKLCNKLPKNITQIAFGIGDIDANKDMWKIFDHCVNNNIVPNVTINGYRMKEDYYNNLAKYCGAVAVSKYEDKNICYDTVYKLSKTQLKYVNIHQLVCEETYDSCFELIEDTKNDIRLTNLYSIVFLLLKQKGRGTEYTLIKDDNKYKKLIDYAFEKNSKVGFDSCFSHIVMNSIKDRKNYKQLEMMIEPCESSLFSSYINVDGEYWNCSFVEGNENYNPVNVLQCEDFIKDVWYNPEIIKFRNSIINNNRQCPLLKNKNI